MCYKYLCSLGFSLIEMLIALMIITSVFLGIISLQSLALRQVHAADLENVAMEQAQALLERFRANCSPTGFAQEFSSVQQQLAHFLPQGRCEYHCAGTVCTVSMFWQNHGEQALTLSSLI
jgi:prepilin-type N-terminal cleavage/methylation domain-containing protein